MSKFNSKTFRNQTVLTCKACSTSHLFAKASSGCPSCGNHLFTVSNRGTGFPSIHDRDKKDPYERQHQAPNDGKNDGSGNRYVTPGDEEWDGSHGGTRAREGFPDGISERDDYGTQKERSIPGDYDDGGIWDDGDIAAERSYQLSGDFADPIDPTSTSQEMERRNEPNTLEKQLGTSRSESPRIRKHDSIYDKVVTKQKGFKR